MKEASKYSPDQLDRLWEKIDSQALMEKQSAMATFEIARIYRASEPEFRKAAREAFGRWLLSPNERMRFDALALIREFDVFEAIPNLRRLQQLLDRVQGSEAEFDREKVRDVLRYLDVAARTSKP